MGRWFLYLQGTVCTLLSKLYLAHTCISLIPLNRVCWDHNLAGCWAHHPIWSNCTLCFIWIPLGSLSLIILCSEKFRWLGMPNCWLIWFRMSPCQWLSGLIVVRSLSYGLNCFLLGIGLGLGMFVPGSSPHDWLGHQSHCVWLCDLSWIIIILL